MNRPRNEPIDLGRIRTYSIADRPHKVDLDRQAGLPPAGATFAAWYDSLPGYLGAAELRAVAGHIVAARRAGRPVVFALGAHVIKVGCAPIVVDLIRRGVLTAVAMNGATAIHDVELGLFGETSEEVGDTLRDGRFGMVRETADFFAAALRRAADGGRGLGAACGEELGAGAARYRAGSVLAAAAEAGLPATVHVAIGTDTIHMHPQIDGAALGAASAFDFRLLCGVVAGCGDQPSAPGGVWCNVGSAVLLPEVFLKAVAVARNLGHPLDSLHTANFDMTRQYRPAQNVIGRPVSSGHGHQVIGQHEILLPLLRQAVIETWSATGST